MSTYWGIVLLAYGIGLWFLPSQSTGFVAQAVFWVTLVLISLFFLMKGRHIDTPQAAEQNTQTKRNALILLGFVVLVAAVFYLYTVFYGT